MQAWEEAKDSGELGSDSDGSEDEDELTGVVNSSHFEPPKSIV
jgi:hypothetical protein